MKLLTRGGQSVSSIRRHLSYPSRKGDLEIETDAEERITGKEAEKALLEDWDLDMDTHRTTAALGPRKRRTHQG